MSVYMYIIIISNYVHYGDVAYVAMLWRQTWLCSVAGSIMLMSQLMSNLTTLLISIDKFQCLVLNPMQRIGFKTNQCIILLSVVYSISFVLISIVYLDWETVQTSLCILVGNSVSMLFSVIYFGVSMLAFLVIVFTSFAIVRTLITSSNSVKRKYDTKVMVRLTLVVLTNFLPILALSIISVLSVISIYIPPSIEASIAFILFPLNACINPMINTVTTRKFLSKHPLFILTIMYLNGGHK